MSGQLDVVYYAGAGWKRHKADILRGRADYYTILEEPVEIRKKGYGLSRPKRASQAT